MEMLMPALVSIIGAGLLLVLTKISTNSTIKKYLMFGTIIFIMFAVIQSISIDPTAITVSENQTTINANTTITNTTYYMPNWDTVWKIGYTEVFVMIFLLIVVGANLATDILQKVGAVFKR